MWLRRTLALLACYGMLLSASPLLAADSFLCPRTKKWVSIGDGPSKVLEKCGSPKYREDVAREGCTDDGLHCFGKLGERWVYDFGRAYLMRYLLFVEGRLTQSEEGEYGGG
jgi:hypothetical protein